MNRVTFKKITDAAAQQWRLKVLGEAPRPSNFDGGFSWNAVEVSALLLLGLLILFTGFKAALHAIPVADSMYKILVSDTTLIGIIIPQWLFTVSMQLVFFVLTEAGLIYFTILAYTMPKVPFTSWRVLFDIKFIMSKLPFLAIVGIVMYIVQISYSDKGTFVDNYLPVIVGLGLSIFVKDIMERRAAAMVVRMSLYNEAKKIYDSRKENMTKDPTYILLVLHGLEKWFNDNKVIDANTPRAVIESKLKDTYLQHTVADNLANILSMRVTQEVKDERGRKPPPNGMKEWTKDALAADFKTSGFTPQTRKELDALYLHARKAFAELHKK